jgi:hypothetical protein
LPLDYIDNVPVKFEDIFEDGQITSFTQTIVETETEIDVTTSLDDNVEEMQHEVATEIPFETVDAIISLVPMGGADLRVLGDELVTQSQDDTTIPADTSGVVQIRDTPAQIAEFMEKQEEVMAVCGQLSSEDYQVVMNALDSLTAIIERAELTGQTQLMMKILGYCDALLTLEDLMIHASAVIRERVKTVLAMYFSQDADLDKICEEAKRLCGELIQNQEDDDVLLCTLNSLWDLLQGIPDDDGDFLECVLQAIAECGGEDLLSMLPEHGDEDVESRSIDLLERYFSYEAILDHTSQTALRVQTDHIQKLCADITGSDGQTAMNALDGLRDIVTAVDGGDVFTRADDILTDSGGRGSLEVLEKYGNGEIACRAEGVLVLLRARELTGEKEREGTIEEEEEEEEGQSEEKSEEG